MTHQTLGRVLAAVAFGGGLAAGTLAYAQATSTAPRAPAAPAQAPLPAGPNIPGLCVFAQGNLIANSAVGKFVIQRLQQLQSQTQAELQAEGGALQTDAKTLEGQRASLSSDVVQQRALALQQRDQALQRKIEQRGRELELTQQTAISRVMTEATPLLRQVYVQHSCSVLLDGNSVLTVSGPMDVTPDVVRLIDAKITQFPFERSRLDQQPGAPAAAAPRQ